MERKLGVIYNKIANKISSIIPTDWNEVYYLGEVEKYKKSWSSVFYFTPLGENSFIKSHDIPKKYNVSKDIYMDLLKELDMLLLELYDVFAENEQTLWEQLKFNLNNMGKFKVDFAYDVFNENDGGQVKREIVWAYETFGFEPNGGTYSWKVFHKYLEGKKN